MEKNKEIQQKYLELKSLEQQINHNQQQISVLNKQIAEFKNLSDNLIKINSLVLNDIESGFSRD